MLSSSWQSMSAWRWKRKTEKVNMPTAKYHSKLSMRCRRCNKIRHKAAQCRYKGYTGHRESAGQPRNCRESTCTRGDPKHSILQNLQCFVCVEDHTKHGIVIIDMILHLSAQELLTMRHHSGSSKENVHAEHIRTHIQFVWPGQVKDRIGLRWTRHLWMGVWKWCMHLPLLILRT